jgi:hypothetical protein
MVHDCEIEVMSDSEHEFMRTLCDERNDLAGIEVGKGKGDQEGIARRSLPSCMDWGYRGINLSLEWINVTTLSGYTDLKSVASSIHPAQSVYCIS